MYGFSIKQVSIASVDLIYDHLLDGAMAIEHSAEPPIQPNRTFKGVSLVESENPGLLEQLGSDMILFTEWCEHWCNWRRRGYLVAVNELTRIIHNQFRNAQIEVSVVERGLRVAVRELANGTDDSVLGRGHCDRVQRGFAGQSREYPDGHSLGPHGEGLGSKSN